MGNKEGNAFLTKCIDMKGTRMTTFLPFLLHENRFVKDFLPGRQKRPWFHLNISQLIDRESEPHNNSGKIIHKNMG